MAKFMFAYHGGKKPETPEAGAEFMAKWMAWSKGLNHAWETPGAPVGQSKTISAEGVTNDGGPNPLSGYSIINAENIEAALEMAKNCPHLEHGSIEVAPIMDMEM